MSLKQQLDTDLKAAMLAGDKPLVSTLRGLKSAILYVEVAKGVREQGLDDEGIMEVLSKEAKKRQESADLYEQGGSSEKAEAELTEKAVIEKYLPAQLSEAEVLAAVQAVIAETAATGPQQMGQVIGAVKQRLGQAADGALIARLTKEQLS